MSIEDYNKILKKHFNLNSLKKEQYDIINTIVNFQKDVMAILATGFGKSICYQLPYLITKKCVIVVSPLIALMTDQKVELEKKNIPVISLNSSCKNKELIMDEIINSDLNQIIYITPEYMPNCELFLTSLYEEDRICLIAIDESHCVSSWGNDFRPKYKDLSCLKNWLPDVPILAMTATATENVKKDISKILKLDDPYVITGNFDRPNLYISVKKRTTPENDIIDLVTKYPNDYVIIYCQTRDDTEKISGIINKYKIKCGSYHAGLNNKTREQIQKDFIDGTYKCIVATIAFGMGINIPNVRLVVHYNCPKNLENYYQEIGRAGRDGKSSECHLFYSKKDFMINRMFLDTIKDPKYKDYQENQIRNIERYTYSQECRRKILLKPFDSNYNKDNCANCDNCKRKEKNIKLVDFTYEVILVLMTLSKLFGSYGMNTYVNIIRGSNAKNITAVMKGINTYNKGNEYSIDFLKELFNLLKNNLYLEERQIDNNKGFKFGGGSTINITKKSELYLNSLKEKYNFTKFDEIKSIIIEDSDKIKLEPSLEMDKFLSKIVIKSKIDNFDVDLDKDIMDRLIESKINLNTPKKEKVNEKVIEKKKPEKVIKEKVKSKTVKKEIVKADIPCDELELEFQKMLNEL